jgi:hypothetical protein
LSIGLVCAFLFGRLVAPSISRAVNHGQQAGTDGYDEP